MIFCDIIGDLNELHRKHGDARVLINGMYSVCLVGGILSKLYPESINIQRSAKFIRPIYLDESYKIVVKLCDIIENTPALFDGCYNGREIVVGQRHIRRALL